MAGRPKASFSEEEIHDIEQLALEGCQTGTIATITGIPYNTLKRHFGKNMHKKRCERKKSLRAKQNALADKYPAMAIFLGKNELNQTDKQVVETTDKTAPALSDAERKALADLSRKFNVKIANTG